MRKGRFFRHRRHADPEFAPVHHPRFGMSLRHDRIDDALHQLSHYGRQLRTRVESTTREHPIATLVSASVLGGLLLWALLRRPTPHRSEGEGLQHW